MTLVGAEERDVPLVGVGSGAEGTGGADGSGVLALVGDGAREDVLAEAGSCGVGAGPDGRAVAGASALAFVEAGEAAVALVVAAGDTVLGCASSVGVLEGGDRGDDEEEEGRAGSALGLAEGALVFCQPGASPRSDRNCSRRSSIISSDSSSVRTTWGVMRTMSSVRVVL